MPNSPAKPAAPAKDVGKSDTATATAAKPAAAAAAAAPSLDPKPKLDPKDFIFLKRKGEKLVKAPGTINGQQFVIDSCEDCEIYVLDMCDSLMIDDCKNCKIVVGPTTGSIFIRDCEECTCVFMCRQYRCRDCKNIDTYLHVTTRPIIETSTNMRFGCWDFHYEGLKEQMDKAGISVYQNFWSHIYNFNPDSATWSLLPAEDTSAGVLDPLPDFPELAGVAEQLADGARPPLCVKTWGERPPADMLSGGEEEGCLVMIPSADAHMAAEVLQMADSAKVLLVRTNICQLNEAWLKPFLDTGGAAVNDEGVKALVTGKCVGLEFGGAGCVDALRGIASSAGFAFLDDADNYAEWRYMGVEG